jgi:charged multivesicular body protein 3
MFKGLFVKEPDPKEMVRKWQADLRKETRNLDRQIRGE